MAATGSVLYIIPAYNEGQVIADTIRNLLAEGPPGQVVVIDDGSQDDTGSCALAAGATVLTHIVNRGQGAALQTGFAYAQVCGAPVVVTFDADGQHDPTDVPKLIDPILSGEVDVVMGSRFLEGSESPHMPPLRRLILRGGVWFTRFMSRVPVTDTHNGLRALSSTALAAINLRLDDMAHASELIDEIYRRKLSFKEVPCRIRYSDYSMAKGQRSGAALRIAWTFFLEKLRP